MDQGLRNNLAVLNQMILDGIPLTPDQISLHAKLMDLVMPRKLHVFHIVVFPLSIVS